MDPVSILKSWLEPVTGPLQEFSSQVESLASINQNSVNTFNTLVNDLTDSYLPDAFTGPAANAMSTLAGDYVTTEATVADTAALSAPMIEAGAASDTMVEGIMEAIFTAGSEVTDTGPLEAVTSTVDVAAAAQGGIDVPNDVAAAGLTGVEALTLIGILVQFLGTLFLLWVTWQSTLDGLANQHYPELPERPKPVQPPIDLTFPPMPSDGKLPTPTSEEKNLAQTLAKEYGNRISVEEILDIIPSHPNASEAEIRALIEAYLRLRKDFPTVPRSYFMSFIEAGFTEQEIRTVLKLIDSYNIKYLRGFNRYDAPVDNLVAILSQLIDIKADELRRLKDEADSKGIQSIDPQILGDLPKSALTFLQLAKSDDMYDRMFGTAVEDMIDKALKRVPGFQKFKETYKLQFNQPLPGETVEPDIQLRLPSGRTIVIDFTTYSQTDKKNKYDLPGVNVLIVVRHSGPDH